MKPESLSGLIRIQCPESPGMAVRNARNFPYSTQFRENINFEKNVLIDNINDVISKAGFKYMEDYFGDDFSGFSKSLGCGNYLIGFNLNQNWNDRFKQFTLAHELGHLSIPGHRKILDRTSIHCSNAEYQSNLEIERDADLFAINFLVPSELFIDLIKHKNFSRETIYELSEIFNISPYSAALRFVEMTDLSCSLIVCCNSNHIIDYEKRSKKLQQTFKHDYISRQQISEFTLTWDWMMNNKDDVSWKSTLNEWYHDLSIEISCMESVIELGYNNKFLTLIEPLVANIEEYI